MTTERDISAVFRELSPENQSILLDCARLARRAECAGRRASGEEGRTERDSGRQNDREEDKGPRILFSR